MSARCPDPGQSSLEQYTPPDPPYQRGDFAIIVPRKKFDLIWCPICALSPDRSVKKFKPGERRDQHFFDEHDADDIGRPMAELLPEAGDGR